MFWLNISIDLLLIWAIFKLRKELLSFFKHVGFCNAAFNEKLRRLPKIDYSRYEGLVDKFSIQSKVAEKMADRAFNMASSANLGVIALQKSLAMPRPVTKTSLERNKLASKEIDSLWTTAGGYDYLRPILSDEDLELLDQAEEHNRKFNESEPPE